MFRKIVIPIASGEGSTEAADFGLRLAQYHGATVLLVSVIERQLIYLPPIAFSEEGEAYEDLLTGTKETLQSLRQVGRQMGLTVRTIIREGNPAAEILDVARREHADLIVMASHSHGRIAELLLGGVSQAVLRHAPCPVLIRGVEARQNQATHRPAITVVQAPEQAPQAGTTANEALIEPEPVSQAATGAA